MLKYSHSWLLAGAGMIFSQGLMRMRGYEEIELAVRSMNWAHQGAGGLPPPPCTASTMLTWQQQLLPCQHYQT